MLLTNVKSVHLLIVYIAFLIVIVASSPSPGTKSPPSVTSNNNDINSLLINDLNLIATKMDDIPETSLNLKLFLLAYECTDVKLTWKLHTTSGMSSSYRTTSLAKNGELFHHHKTPPKRFDPKIFGYQVVVREYLEPKSSNSKQKTSPPPLNSDEIYEKQNEKTVRVYSSKFIESNQNKFKLINLLRRNMASYLICLIIYMDVTETVALEKQCVNFSLPVVSKEFDSLCDRNTAASTSPANAKTKTSKLNSNLDENGKKLSNSRPKSAEVMETKFGGQTTLQLASRNTTTPSMRTNMMTASGMIGGGGGLGVSSSNGGCEHVAQCKHYANLLVAFVVCGVLLGTNVFMFTIIIIQNTIKLGLLRNKLKIYRNTQSRLFTNLPNSASGSHFVDSNKDLDDKSFLHSNTKFDKYGTYITYFNYDFS